MTVKFYLSISNFFRHFRRRKKILTASFKRSPPQRKELSSYFWTYEAKKPYLNLCQLWLGLHQIEANFIRNKPHILKVRLTPYV